MKKNEIYFINFANEFIAKVNLKYNVDLKIKNRTIKYVFPRFIVTYLLVEKLEDFGLHQGHRGAMLITNTLRQERTNIYNSLKKHEIEMRVNDEYVKMFNEIREFI